jgi:hypothetical protein
MQGLSGHQRTPLRQGGRALLFEFGSWVGMSFEVQAIVAQA